MLKKNIVLSIILLNLHFSIIQCGKKGVVHSVQNSLGLISHAVEDVEKEVKDQEQLETVKNLTLEMTKAVHYLSENSEEVAKGVKSLKREVAKTSNNQTTEISNLNKQMKTIRKSQKNISSALYKLQIKLDNQKLQKQNDYWAYTPILALALIFCVELTRFVA